MKKWKCLSLSCIWLFVTPWTVAHQAPLSILQARILERVSIPFSRGSSQPRDPTAGLLHCRKILYCLSHQEIPYILYIHIHTPLSSYRRRCTFCSSVYQPYTWSTVEIQKVIFESLQKWWQWRRNNVYCFKIDFVCIHQVYNPDITILYKKNDHCIHLFTGTNVRLTLFANTKKLEGPVMWEHCGKRILLVSE